MLYVEIAAKCKNCGFIEKPYFLKTDAKYILSKTCEKCNGEGSVFNETCWQCGGEGVNLDWGACPKCNHKIWHLIYAIPVDVQGVKRTYIIDHDKLIHLAKIGYSIRRRDRVIAYLKNNSKGV